MRITVLAGGVGGAKFVSGLRSAFGGQADITVIVNTGDDMWLTGLRVCPDLDSLMYALAGVNDSVQGWGRATESNRVSAELQAYGVGWPWFTLGDLDLGTHICRTSHLRDGLTLTEATAELCRRWPLGVTLLPATDDEVETMVDVELPEGRALLHFEEWWVRHRGNLPTHGFVQQHVAEASTTPQVRTALTEADLIIVAPSNPVVSIDTILGIPGLREELRTAPGPVVGVAPIISGAPVRGMADRCLETVGIPVDAGAVGLHYGSRHNSPDGILDGWLVDLADAAALAPLAEAGISGKAVPLWMADPESSAQLARDAVEHAESARRNLTAELPAAHH